MSMFYSTTLAWFVILLTTLSLNAQTSEPPEDADQASVPEAPLADEVEASAVGGAEDVPPTQVPVEPNADLPGDENDAEHLLRGPVHEAFAEPIQLTPEQELVVPREPPPPVEEVPPEIDSKSERSVWVPGYWAWDDEREDFIWISGVWRNAPVNREWTPGNWEKDEDGYRWNSGRWIPNLAKGNDVLLPVPPESLEEGPTSDPPSDDHFWVPGTWRYQDDRFVWRPGFWSGCHQNWVWVPDYYSPTVHGCYFVPGYWDYGWEYRGTLFAPCYFRHYGRGIRYRPNVVVDFSGAFRHLWVRPGYCHYYFGDFYDGYYSNYGIYPWFSYQHRHHRFYDPLYVHYHWKYKRHRVDLYRDLHGRHAHYTKHKDHRPARNFRDHPTRGDRDRHDQIARHINHDRGRSRELRHEGRRDVLHLRSASGRSDIARTDVRRPASDRDVLRRSGGSRRSNLTDAGRTGRQGSERQNLGQDLRRQNLRRQSADRPSTDGQTAAGRNAGRRTAGREGLSGSGDARRRLLRTESGESSAAKQRTGGLSSDDVRRSAGSRVAGQRSDDSRTGRTRSRNNSSGANGSRREGSQQTARSNQSGRTGRESRQREALRPPAQERQPRSTTRQQLQNSLRRSQSESPGQSIRRGEATRRTQSSSEGSVARPQRSGRVAEAIRDASPRSSSRDSSVRRPIGGRTSIQGRAGSRASSPSVRPPSDSSFGRSNGSSSLRSSNGSRSFSRSSGGSNGPSSSFNRSMGRSSGPSMGSRSMGSRSMGGRSMGSRSMGSRSMGSRSMGSRSMGGRSMGGGRGGRGGR